MNSLRRNLVANWLGQGWSAIANIAFVPIYIRYLGIEAYGLIGFYSIVFSAVSLLDAGMSPALNREMANHAAGVESVQRAGDLLRSVEMLFLICLCFICLVGIISAPWVAAHWLNRTNLDSAQVAHSFALMVSVSALRLLEGVYRNVMLGLQRHAWLNVAVASLATLKTAGAALVLAFVSNDVEVYFWWQGAAGLLSVAVLAFGAYSCLARPRARSSFAFRKEALNSIRKFAGGVLITSVLGTMLVQVDKVILSRILSLEAFGYYSLATSISTALYQLVFPITQSYYPRFTDLIAKKRTLQLSATYHQASELITLATAPAALMMVFFAERIIHAWSGDLKISSNTAPMLSLLAAGTLLHGFMYIPYMLQLANGMSGFAARVNIVAVALLVPAICFVAPRYGAIGAAWMWILLNVGYITFSIHFMHKITLVGEQTRWYVRDLVVPTMACAAVVYPMSILLPSRLWPDWELLKLCVCTVTAYAACLVALPGLRRKSSAT